MWACATLFYQDLDINNLPMPEADINKLRYPFYKHWPAKFFSKVRWKFNEWKNKHLSLLNRFGCKLSIIDTFGSPGDTLITAIIIKNIKDRYPKIKINCITGYPSLLELDPHINSLNEPEGYFSVVSWYFEILVEKPADVNIIQPTLRRLGIESSDYKTYFFLSPKEKEIGKKLLQNFKRPIITINCLSKEPVKNWSIDSWARLIEMLKGEASIIQLGDDREPVFSGMLSFAGKLSLRESAAVLANSGLHIGPDSFLVHAASGLDVPAVVIFGGSRTPKNLGYEQNENIYAKTDCSPCWIYSAGGQRCQHDLKCLKMITPEMVYEKVMAVLEITKHDCIKNKKNN